MSAGVLYVATGEFLEEAKLSARQLRNHMADIPIAVVTDRSTDAKYFDTVLECPDPEHHFGGEKVANIRRSPYDKTLYLDSDTYVTEDISEIFDLLNHYEIALAHAPERVNTPVEGIPECFPEFNTGVFAFVDTPAVQTVLERWQEIYDQNRDTFLHDGPAFRKAVYASEASVATLPSEYNCRWPFSGYVGDDVKIFHGHLMEFESEIQGKEPNIAVETAVEQINSKKDSRVFINRDGELSVEEL